MLDRPRFKSCFHVEIVDGVGVFLLTESDYFLLTGRVYELLASRLDGQQTVDELVLELETEAAPAEIYYALMTMESRGYIVENEVELPEGFATLADALHVDRHQAAERVRSAKIVVTAFGNVPAQQFVSQLRSLGLQVEETSAAA